MHTMKAIMKKPWIIFDMDEVIVNIRDPLAEHLNVVSGKNIPSEDWYQHDLSGVYGIENSVVMETLASSRCLERATIEPDAVASIVRAKELGYRVGILTALGWHPKGLDLTQKSVVEYQLPIDHIVAVPIDAKKSDSIRANFPGEIIGFIDDNATHVEGVGSIGILSCVRDRPWNQDVMAHKRIFNLSDFVEYAHTNYEMSRSTAYINSPILE